MSTAIKKLIGFALLAYVVYTIIYEEDITWTSLRK